MFERPRGRDRCRGNPPRGNGNGGKGGVLQVPVDISVPFKTAKNEMVAEFERRYLRDLMREHKGNVSKAARAAGLDRMTVHKMLNRAGIAPR